MERKKLIILSIAAAAGIIAAVVAVFVLMNLAFKTPAVHLPEATSNILDNSDGSCAGADEQNSMLYAQLRPDPVQYMLNTIKKPESYSMEYTVESFWDGGSGAFSVKVYVRDGAYRVSQDAGAYRRECIFTPEEYYIWYSDSDRYFHATRDAGVESAVMDSAMQMSGSYTALMELDSELIHQTAYEEFGETYCVFVSAETGAYGYRSDFYISLDTGLLLKQEIYDGERIIYRMTAESAELSAPDDEHFALPDGSIVQ